MLVSKITANNYAVSPILTPIYKQLLMRWVEHFKITVFENVITFSQRNQLPIMVQNGI